MMGGNMGSSSMVKVWLLFAATALLITSACARGFEDLPGSYCAKRGDTCCTGRMDDCSVRVFETRCYCDHFCNRTSADDCCPDYWNVCLGMAEPKPPAVSRCYAGGRYYNYGEEVKVNCNKCKCQPTGEHLDLVCEDQPCLLEESVLSGINADRELGWRAANYSAFWGRTLGDGLALRTGTLEPDDMVMRMQPIIVKDQTRLPRSFDARSKWPGLVGQAIDQGWCGSSWAVSTATVASDRYGIMSSGLEKVQLAAQHLLSCNKRGQRGCQGGHLARAWMYTRKYGLVNEECYPWEGRGEAICRLPRKTTLRTARCKPLMEQKYRTELYKVGPAYRIKGEEDIMHEIQAYGPVQATMKVYQDFFAYKSGVYRKSDAGRSTSHGYHSVRLIGWGEQIDPRGQPVKYWLAYNSWGPFWGENGLFQILRGSNECGIEEFVLAAWSKVARPVNPPTFNNEPNSLF